MQSGDAEIIAIKGHDVVGIGAALIDHLSFADSSVVNSLDLIPGAMTLIDADQADVCRRALPDGKQVSGGTVANTLAGVASLGGAPGFIGAVGADELGDRYARDLEEADVAARIVTSALISKGPATGCCYVVVGDDGARTMATFLGVSGELSARDVDTSFLTSARLVYVDGYCLDWRDAKGIVDLLLSLRDSSPLKLALGLADPYVVDRHQVALVDLVAHVDLLMSNEDEAIALTGSYDARAAAKAMVRSGLTVAVTKGKDGAIVANSEELIEVEAAEVKEVVDVTGAGDLFAAGMCFGYTHGLSLAQCARLGALCASEVISHIGARPQISLAPFVAQVSATKF